MRVTVPICAIGASALLFGCSDAADESVARSGESVVGLSGETIQTRVHAGSCMDVTGNSSADGTQIEELTCSGGPSQIFQVQATATAGAYRIFHTASGKCVDVRSSGTANGTKVEIWDCNGTGAQSFNLKDAGSGGAVTFVNTNSKKCLDVSASNPADGTHVQLWDCNGTNAQAWVQSGEDAGAPDAGSPDANGNDAGSIDAGHDAGVIDAGSADAGAADAGHDAGGIDAGADANDAGSGLPTGASDWLTPMNAARAAVGEAPFKWDPIAAEVAQSWANQCSFGHNPSAGSEYASLGGGSGGLGEDVAAGAPTESVANAVASWVNEDQYYDHATNTCASGQVCGHYTQIVWKNSTAVGCAQTHCTTNSPFGSSFPAWDMSVCDFNPAGNYVGESPY